MSKLSTPIYPGLSVPKYYSAINSTVVRNTELEDSTENRSLNPSPNPSSEPATHYWSDMTEKINLFCMKYQDYICIPILCILAIFALYVFIILIVLFCVLFNFVFEKTMVFMIGRDLYNKNFPICTDTTYISSNCYSTKNTYCS